ncbi:coiled-coil domain-containing protein 39 isoform X1 [Xiphophorus couchianus]|uniref:coiled-coil domain-containing protein 39 isoform X1 n=1 Tax=Xiphophorus couchianus TaxID=32473 RepID=UPI0010169A67|nr:coiled-coil domain-containing protein 39-like isoform X1 [Xiphophorus couchianus]
MASRDFDKFSDPEFDKILYEIGWDYSFVLPELNDANKALMEEIYKAEMQVLQEDNEIKGIRDRQQLMSENLQRCTLQLVNTEALMKANEKELEVTKHLKTLAERERSRYCQLTAQAEREIRSSYEKMDRIEKSQLKATQNLEELRLQMDLDQQTMENLLAEAAKKDEDLMVIMKYTQMDEHKIKSLTLTIEKKTLEVKEKRKALDKELTETRSTQLALDKSIEDIQRARAEIQHLFHLCENTIKQKKQLDSDMERCSFQIAQGRQKTREKNTCVAEMKHKLDTERSNNRELQRNIATARMQKAVLRQDLKKHQENLARMQVELDSYKTTLNQNRCDMKSVTSQISRMKMDIDINNHRLLEGEAYHAALQEKLRLVTEGALSKEERAAHMEQILLETEQEMKMLEAQQQDLMEELFRQRQSFQSAKVKEKNLIALASKNKFTITNLLSQLTKMENTLIRQQMINNNQEAKVLMLQRKVAQLSGASHTNESEMLEVKVKELTANLEDKKETTKILKNALNECEIDIRCAKKEMEKLEAQKKDLTDEVDCLLVLCVNKEKELKKLKLKKQDGLVNNNLLKTEVKRVRDIIYIDADSMMSWEMRKLELEKAMKEREEEIHVYSEMLRHQLKFTELDRQKLSMELNEELSKVEMVKNRFEIMESSLAGSEGEKSQIYYITKATLDKEELRRKSEDMKDHIQKMELETKALENTIHLFSGRCSDYSNGLSEMKKFSEEYQEKMQLEERLKTVEETLKLKKRQIQELRQEIQDMNSTWESLMLEEKVEKEKTRHVQGLIANLNKEAASVKERIGRVMNQFTKLTREVRSAQSTRSETLEEQDIKLKELKQFNKSINNMLSKAMEEDPDLRPVLEERFQKDNLQFPPPTSTLSSQGSFKLSSARSSLSSRSSASSAGSSHSKSLPWVKTVNLNLDLSAAYPTITSPKSPSSPSSSDSSSSKKTK